MNSLFWSSISQRYGRPGLWGVAALLLSLMSGTLSIADSTGILLSPSAIEKVGTRYGAEAVKRVTAWQKLMNTAQAEAEKNKLKLVNDFFNRVRYVSDWKHWKQEDYWATPVEMLGTFGGDCEDYSISKYLTLRQLGVSEEKLRITYVKAITLNEAHMVLSYYPTPDAEPLILDNLNKKLLKASLRTDLVPIYSFNGSGLWVAKGPGGGKKAGSSSRLKRWNKLRDKLKRDGG